MSQLSFDIDEMIHAVDVATAPEWTGAPLRFTATYRDPEELTEAFARWVFENGRFDCLLRSHMWSPSYFLDRANQHTHGHDLRVFSADLRCRCWPNFKGTAAQWAESGRCSCVGGLITHAVCSNCRWHHIGNETQVVEAWHDHAWADWRSLPVVPQKVQRRKDNGAPMPALTRWINENYPDAWQIPGAPILTQRTPPSTRHVPRRSPWGGFDLSAQIGEIQ